MRQSLELRKDPWATVERRQQKKAGKAGLVGSERRKVELEGLHKPSSTLFIGRISVEVIQLFQKRNSPNSQTTQQHIHLVAQFE